MTKENYEDILKEAVKLNTKKISSILDSLEAEVGKKSEDEITNIFKKRKRQIKLIFANILLDFELEVENKMTSPKKIKLAK